MEPIELSVLEVISQYEDISQRDISHKIGISLGMVNLLIHKFVKIGFIKIEQLNGKKVQYILTQNGLSMLSKKTIEYISKSYTAVLKIKSHMNEVLLNHYEEGEEVLIFGTHDEVYQILIEVLKEQGRTYREIEEVELTKLESLKSNMRSKFVHWDGEMIGRGLFLLGTIGDKV